MLTVLCVSLREGDFQMQTGEWMASHVPSCLVITQLRRHSEADLENAHSWGLAGYYTGAGSCVSMSKTKQLQPRMYSRLQGTLQTCPLVSTPLRSTHR